jgi:hypothetical protein
MLKTKIFIYDLDNTLINCNSFIYFILYIAKHNKLLFSIKITILLIIYIFHILLKKKFMTFTKSLFIKILFIGLKKKEILLVCQKLVQEVLLNSLNKKLYSNIKKIKNKNKLFLITASPNIYVEIFAKELKINNVFSTNISLKNKTFGNIIGKNCYADEKKKIILKNIKNFKKLRSYFYTDCISDAPLMNICSKSFLIK